YTRLTELAMKLADQIEGLAKKYNIQIQVNRYGGAFSVYFTDQPVIDYEGAQASDSEKFAQFFRALLANGVYIAPSKYEAWFLTTAHQEEHIDFTIRAVEKAFRQMSN